MRIIAILVITLGLLGSVDAQEPMLPSEPVEQPVPSASEQRLADIERLLESLVARLDQDRSGEEQELALAELRATLARQGELLATQSELLRAQTAPAKEDASFFDLRLIAELGFLAPLYHAVRFGKNGTRFDYVEQGGQDNLFLVGRLSAELVLAKRHFIIFLYQPLDLRTKTRLSESIVVDDIGFAKGTQLDLRYGFDFYRVSYLYDFFAEHPDFELSVGGSLQVRNATIDFATGDGFNMVSRRDVGPVPALKLRSRYDFANGLFLGAEVDGIYAPVKVLNGGKSDVEGAIIDLSVRVGVPVAASVDTFLNLRYLAGGAEGTSSSPAPGSDGFSENWLHFLTVTLGVQWDLQRALR